jgi:multimeric flavodoxin WrbA
VCGIIGSPVKNGNVDLLVSEVLRGARSKGAHTHKVYLNDLCIKPCQSCGTDPRPEYCIIHDDMDTVYAELESCDSIVLGSPVYFDSVTAQTKLMIDRCNCLRPCVKRPNGKSRFESRFSKTKKGVFVAVGGSDQRLDPILATVRGFFSWANIQLTDRITFMHSDDCLGGVAKITEKVNEAYAVGIRIAARTEPRWS